MGKEGERERVRVSVVGCEGTPDQRPAACRRDQIRQTEEKEAPLATRMPTDITEMKLWQLEGKRMRPWESVDAQFQVFLTPRLLPYEDRVIQAVRLDT